MPGNHIIDACASWRGHNAAGPGLVTDTIGLLLVIPGSRFVRREWIKRRLLGMIDRGQVIFRWHRW